jgi:hypothetical protein
MKLTQLSIFLENKPGSLTLPCRLLAQAGINILTFALADTQQFGIVRLIVREVEQARRVLEAGGCLVKLTEVVALEVPDRPGGLVEVLEVLDQGRINVEYMYACTIKQNGKGVLVFRFGQPDAAIALLRARGVALVDDAELARRLGV